MPGPLEPSTRASAPVGEVLDGKWRLEQKIGEGGMGTVYLAQDLQLERKVAIKLLSGTLVNDAELVERFEREARLTARLEHPNVVPVYAVGRHGDRPFMVMKYLEGAPLSSHLRKQGGLGRDELLPLLRQVAAGLDFIHARGFIHRDVKTSNIFVGPGGEATILDFGIVRPSRGAPALTRTGMVMGTPQYLAPEQALGVRDIDHRADLYAFATVIFECIAGSLPFEGENELQIIQLQAHAPPPDLRQRASWIPDEVAAVMTRALAKRPEDRFATAGALCAALEHAFGVVLFTGPGGVPLISSVPRTPAAPVDVQRPSPSQAGQVPVPYPIPLGVAPGAEAVPLAVTASRPIAAPVATPDTQPSLRVKRQARAWRKRWAIAGAFAAVLVGAAVVIARTSSGGDSPAVAAPAAAVVSATEPPSVPELLPSEPLAPRQTETPAPAATPAAGTLNVITTYKGGRYWASLSVNGEKKGTTPALLELPAGSHRVRVERTGFKPVEKQIKIAPGGSAVVRIELVP